VARTAEETADQGRVRDPRVEAAVSHWAHRFVANGVPLSDFQDVTGGIRHWDEWCPAWSQRAAVHEQLGDEALAAGQHLTAGEHLERAAVCYHFAKYLFVQDQAQLRQAHRRAVDRVRSEQAASQRESRYGAANVDPPSDQVADSVILRDEERNALYFAAATGPKAHEVLKKFGESGPERVPLKGSKAGLVFRRGRSLVNQSLAADPDHFKGVDQKIAPILRPHLPEEPDPRVHDITMGNLLSMQAGLGRTSGPNYGRCKSSRDWVRAALAMPFDDEPGGNMLYSTGSTHLLSAILTRAAGRSTLELARDWLGPLEDFSIAGWERDPQGFYLGGNQMAMSPRSLLAFGELYRNGGRTADGEQLVSPEWIETSWRQRTNSRYTGDGYGYGWFMRTIGGQDVRYAWGYGGQMLYIVPELGLTVVMTSEEDNASARNGHRDNLHALLAEIIGAVEAGEQAGGAGAAREG
jgi:hypothetical protein